MQPKILTLPDSLRDRLQAALDGGICETVDSAAVDRGGIVRSILFSENAADSEEKKFISDLTESILALQNGSGIPAITLHNLPGSGESGHDIVRGLAEALGNPDPSPVPVAQTGVQKLHQDSSLNATCAPCKNLVLLYCEKAGEIKQPTVIATADELIDHWANHLVTRGHTFDEARTSVIERLKSIECDFMLGHIYPLLMENPNYREGSPAPHYFFSLDPSKIHQFSRSATGRYMQRELTTQLNSLRNQLTVDAVASTEDNSVTLFNDPLIVHARGFRREYEIGHVDSEKRHVVAYDVHPMVAADDASTFTPADQATALPVSKLALYYADPIESHSSR